MPRVPRISGAAATAGRIARATGDAAAPVPDARIGASRGLGRKRTHRAAPDRIGTQADTTLPGPIPALHTRARPAARATDITRDAR